MGRAAQGTEPLPSPPGCGHGLPVHRGTPPRAPGTAPYHHGNESTHVALGHDEVAQAMQRRGLSQLCQPGTRWGQSRGQPSGGDTEGPFPTPTVALKHAREQGLAGRRAGLEDDHCGLWAVLAATSTRLLMGHRPWPTPLGPEFQNTEKTGCVRPPSPLQLCRRNSTCFTQGQIKGRDPGPGRGSSSRKGALGAAAPPSTVPAQDSSSSRDPGNCSLSSPRPRGRVRWTGEGG